MTPTKTKGVGVTDQPEKKARDGVVADPRLFKFYGTTDCKSCETGRVTLFVANDECMMCNPDSYQAKTPTDSDSVSVPREVYDKVCETLKFYSKPENFSITVWEDETRDGHCWLEPAKDNNLIEHAEGECNSDFGILAEETLQSLSRGGE